MNDRERPPEELEDGLPELIRPEDNASAARSCLVIMLLVVILLAVLAVYLLATVLT